MKTIWFYVMLFSLCSFSAYSHPPGNETMYRVSADRYDETVYSSVIAYYEEGFFTDSFYLHYHYYVPGSNNRFTDRTIEITREQYELIIYEERAKIEIYPNERFIENRVFFPTYDVSDENQRYFKNKNSLDHF